MELSDICRSRDHLKAKFLITAHHLVFYMSDSPCLRLTVQRLNSVKGLTVFIKAVEGAAMSVGASTCALGQSDGQVQGT